MTIDPVFKFFDKLIDQFTWKRLIITLCIPCLLFLCVIGYESYTGTFRLNKIEKTLTLIQQAERLSPEVLTDSKKSLANACKSICKELDIFTSGTGTAFSLHPNILKGLASFAP